MASNRLRTGKKRGNPNPLPPPKEHQFKKGQSGNPGGRPKLLGESYKAMLARVNEQDPQGRTNAELIAEALKLEAMKGDVSAAREIRAATEGDKLELTAKDGLTIHIIYDDASDSQTPETAPETSGLY